MYVEIRAWGSLTVVEAATMQQPRSLEMRGSKQSFSGILPSRSEPNAQLKSIPRYSIFSISLSVSLTQIKIRGISISRERNQLQYIVSKSSFNVFILYYYNLNPTRCSLNIDLGLLDLHCVWLGRFQGGWKIQEGKLEFSIVWQ